jgi:hypothetical protein
MAITHTKLEIMNAALRMVGSYHLDADDTTSATYEIANRAFEDSVNAVFADNIFQYNTKRVLSTGTATTSLTAGEKPSDSWTYRHEAPSDTNLLLHITDKNSTYILPYTFDGSTAGSGNDVPYVFTTEEEIQIYYTFIPDLNSTGTNQGESASRMPSFLVRLLTLHMAQNMSIELSGSENRHEILFKQYTAALRRARLLEGRSSPPQQYIHDGNSSFISSHRYYSNYGSLY